MNRDLNTFKLIRPIMKSSLSFHASKRSVRVQYDKSGRLLISWKIIKKMSLKSIQLKSDDQSSTFKRLDWFLQSKNRITRPRLVSFLQTNRSCCRPATGENHMLIMNHDVVSKPTIYNNPFHLDRPSNSLQPRWLPHPLNSCHVILTPHWSHQSLLQNQISVLITNPSLPQLKRNIFRKKEISTGNIPGCYFATFHNVIIMENSVL